MAYLSGPKWFAPGLSEYDVLDLNNKVSITCNFETFWNHFIYLYYLFIILYLLWKLQVQIVSHFLPFQRLADYCVPMRITQTFLHRSFERPGMWLLSSGSQLPAPRIGQSSEFPQAWSMIQYYIIILIWYTVKIFADLGSILKYSFFLSALDPDIWYMYIT